ncbi:GAF domain-containing protein [Massilia sp. W12]|uniref:GAF domain-containing protein n=1 Tax=Massilia sp. W12 TaxID=3126507 RepID=UPI0030D341CD
MKLFANPELRAFLQDSLRRLQGGQLCHSLLELAWYVRQCDTRHSLDLLQQLEQHWHCCDEQSRSSMQARGQLIRCEADYLISTRATQLQQVHARAEKVLAQAMGMRDEILCADACFLLAWVDFAQSGAAASANWLQEMMQHALPDDWVRADIAQVRLIRLQSLNDHEAARAAWHAWHAMHPLPEDSALQAHIESLQSALTSQRGEYASSIRHLSLAHELAQNTGQDLQALICACNLNDDFNQLHAYASALEWAETSLQTARRHGWPRMLAASLSQAGNTLHLQQQYGAARSMLQEAQQLLLQMPQGRTHAINLQYLAASCLAQGDTQAGLQHAAQMERIARSQQFADLLSVAHRLQADAFLQLGDGHAALQQAQQALHSCVHVNAEKIAACCLLAQIYARHDFAPPPDLQAPSASLHYLLEAQSMAASLQGYQATPELLQQLAAEYRRLGQLQQACEYGQRCLQAYQRTHTSAARARAQALQLHNEAERLRAEAASQQLQLQQQAARAGLLQQTGATLLQLARLGLEITSHLAPQAVYQSLWQQLQQSMRADSFAIFRLDEAQHCLRSVFFHEENSPQLDAQIALDASDSMTALCWREQREIHVNFPPHVQARASARAAQPMGSAIYLPLRVEGRQLGVLTVKARAVSAFDRRERLIIRTLTVYAAIALENCDAFASLEQAHSGQLEAHRDLHTTHRELESAHQQLQNSWEQLLRQEKMALLGQLLSQVAREIRQPTQAMQAASQQINAALPALLEALPQLLAWLLQHGRSTPWLRWLTPGAADMPDAPPLLQEIRRQVASLEQGCDGILQAVAAISALVQALRSFVRSSGELAGAGDLLSGLQAVLTIYRQLWHGQVSLRLDWPELPDWPIRIGELNQVWMHVLQFLLQASGQHGHLHIAQSREDEWLHVRFEIQPEQGARLENLDPGPGIRIAQRIVQELQGSIAYYSQPHSAAVEVLLPSPSGKTDS